MTVFDGLNEAQRQAVAVEHSHVLVVAGPGTGKTFTIVRRIGYLLDHGIPPDQILALTFSNRAAREMKERARAFLGDAVSATFVGTFHLFGLRMLRQTDQGTKSVCTRDKQVDYLKSITGKGARFAEETAEEISRIKNGATLPDDEIAPVYRLYEAALAARGEWDFDDLIRIPVALISQGAVPPQCQGYSHIVVDEYQDVSPMQYNLLRGLSLASGAHVWAVGDPDQAIYAFRGADSGNFRNFQRDFRSARLIVLRENYRSTQMVVGASGAVIAHNQKRIDKELVATGNKGKPISVISVPDEKAEAELVVREIESRMGGTSRYRIMSRQDAPDYGENTYSFSDFAILFRTNTQAAMFRETLETWGIPGQVVGRDDRTMILGVIETLKSRSEDLNDQTDVGALIASVCDECAPGLMDRMLLEGVASPYRHEAPQRAVQAVIDELTLLAALDRYDAEADKVALMTMHAAKGLEFRVVFIVGCLEGLIPYLKAGEAVEVEEERRLFYVAMTRAKEELVILCPRRHFLYGQRVVRLESPFLSEIPKGYVRAITIADPPKKPSKGKQQSLF